VLYAKKLNIISDGNDRSVLLVKVYRQHRIGKGELVGSLTDTIGGILTKLKDGGTRVLCMTWSTDANSAVKVFEDDLRKNTSDGSDLSGITIKFAFATELRADVNADGRQATDAVIRATEVVNPLNSTPAAVVLMGSVVDTSTQVSTEVLTFETTWDVLLQRMELFNKIVAGIAQVFEAQCFADRGFLILSATQIHPYASLAWSVISAANQVCYSIFILSLIADKVLRRCS